MRRLQNKEEYRDYIHSQANICFNCDLFDDKNEHGSKILMLFAEIFPFLSDIYGTNKTSSFIINYSNTEIFKEWFWYTKHILGQSLGNDPTFYDIGNWIGKGLFIKICVSLLIYHKQFLNDKIINGIIEKQYVLIEDLLQNVKNIIIKKEKDHYYILDEKVIISYENELFYIENIIG